MDQPGTPSGNWGRLWDLFHQALDRDLSARAAFLDEACHDDPALRREIEDLLAANDSASCLDGSPISGIGPLAPSALLAGRFEVVRRIGQGGMGTTYEARDRQLGATIALKTLRPEIADSPVAIERFRRELALGRRVTHHNVCRVFDLVEHAADDQPGNAPLVFLTMELLAGETLAERLRREGPLPLADALSIARQVAGALQAAHRVDVIHRDLKPANVMLVREADGTRAVVTDFGIAKTTPSSAADGDGPLTGSGQLLGTPAYMAPEQLEGYDVTTVTDVYAFGMLLYEMTTGRPPFEADTPLAAAARRLARPIPSPRILRPDLDTAWERVILDCLQRSPRDRPQTAGALVDALAAIGKPQRQPAARRVIARWLGVASGLLVAAAMVWYGAGWYQRQRDVRAAQAAHERGDALLREGNAAGAVAELQQAIRLDSNNARAYGSLAHALARLASVDSSSAFRPRGQSPAVAAAQRGVELAPRCAECLGTLGMYLFYHDWEWAKSEARYRDALRLAPDVEAIRASYAMLLSAIGREAEALQEIDRALAKQPYRLSWLIIRASILYFSRRYPEAVAAADHTLLVSNKETSAWEWRSKALFQLGRGPEAIKALAQGPFGSHSADLDRAVREGGTEGGLRTLLEITGDWRGRIESSWRRGPWSALLKDTDAALSEVERAYEARRLNAIYFGVDPVYDAIRDQPRFQRVLEGMGLKQVLTVPVR